MEQHINATNGMLICDRGLEYLQVKVKNSSNIRLTCLSVVISTATTVYIKVTTLSRVSIRANSLQTVL